MHTASPTPVAPLGSWPLRTRLELAALPTAVPCARGHVRSAALGWGLAGLADTAELLMSELVTNAISASARMNATATPVVRVQVFSDRAQIALQVWDSSPGMPARKDSGPDDESGRGLQLVEILSQDWGAYQEAAGKVVWAVIGPNG